MIDPTNITNYNLTHPQLEEELIFWIFAAGHNAKSTARGVENFISDMEHNANHTGVRQPFMLISNHSPQQLLIFLEYSGLGCWRIKHRTLLDLVGRGLNLKTCSVEDLEGVFGIGPKTARGFIMHTRKDARYACIDTHILKFLRAEGIDVPKSTPTGKRYKKLEQDFLRLCDKAGKSPAVYDLEIWNRYAKY